MRSDSPNPSPVPTYADRPATKVPNWHGLVVLDLLFNNLTTGLFLCAAVSELLAPAAFGAVARVAYPLALALLIADLVCLVLDLGDPLRFHHMLRVWKPGSPMSFGTWSLVAYSAPLTVLCAMSLWPGPAAHAEWIRRGVLLVGLLPALGASLYKGVLFSTTAQPGWRETRWLGGYLVNSAFLLGAAFLLGLAVILDQQQAGRVLRPALIALVPLHLVALGLLLPEIGPSLSEVRTRGERVRLGAVVVGGILAPLLLLVLKSDMTHLVVVALLITSAAVARAELVLLPHRLQEKRAP